VSVPSRPPDGSSPWRRAAGRHYTMLLTRSKRWTPVARVTLEEVVLITIVEYGALS